MCFVTSISSLLVCSCDLSVQEIACLEVRHLVSFNTFSTTFIYFNPFVPDPALKRVKTD